MLSHEHARGTGEVVAEITGRRGSNTTIRILSPACSTNNRSLEQHAHAKPARTSKTAATMRSSTILRNDKKVLPMLSFAQHASAIIGLMGRRCEKVSMHILPIVAGQQNEIGRS
mmetsp:Transcript_11157/g.32121  ORF Transcript_11157/g.32121 Transcript_11157/m.32121 type:complete len:114 (+) Transcript_11157:308-649(+)